MRPAPYASADKRAELVAAATRLLHEQGFHRTTLAHVADSAKVPLGNVYYYFKTKDALAEAVITAHEEALRSRFAAWTSAHREPRARLRCFVKAPLDFADGVIQFGCPHGSLCQELEKLGPDAPLSRAAQRLLAVYIDWAEEQFRAHGIGRREARALAADLVGAAQGAMLLAHTMRSKELLTHQLRRVEKWLDGALASRTRKEPIMTQDLHASSLKDGIDTFMQGVAKHAPPEVLAGLAAEIKKLAESGISHGALRVGVKAPDFTLPDAHGKPVTLSALLARGPAVVTFYRGGWCPFCDLQLRAYQGALGAIHELGAELVAISPQTPDYALSDVEKKQLTFPVLTDQGNRVAREFKLVFALSDALRQLQTHFGSVLPKFNGDDSWELPMPGTFVLDRQGVVKFASVDPNWMVRVEPSAILEALRAARS